MNKLCFLLGKRETDFILVLLVQVGIKQGFLLIGKVAVCHMLVCAWFGHVAFETFESMVEAELQFPWFAFEERIRFGTRGYFQPIAFAIR